MAVHGANATARGPLLRKTRAASSLVENYRRYSRWGGALMTSGSFTMMASTGD